MQYFRRLKNVCYLLPAEKALDQGAHHLLWGASRANVRQNEVAMSLLSIADPTCSQHKNVHVINYSFAVAGI